MRSEVAEEPVVVEPVDPFEGRRLEVLVAASGEHVADEFRLADPDG